MSEPDARLQAIINALVKQRDDALNALANAAGEIAALQEIIAKHDTQEKMT